MILDSILLSDKQFQKNLQKNNSSFFTAENTSIIQSNIKNSNSLNKTGSSRSLKNINNIKYLNSTIFTYPHKNRKKLMKLSNITSSPNTSKENFQLYLTESKNVITPQYKPKKKKRNLYRSKNKKSLPTLKCYSHWDNKYPDIFTCGDFSMKPKYLTKLYYKQNDNSNQINKIIFSNNVKDIDENKKNVDKVTIREYINNANKRNFLNYCINSKKEALEEYKKNMESQIKSLNYTISQISSYKENLEKNFDIKYNEDKKDFELEIKRGKFHCDLLKKHLLSLLRDVGALSQMIIKKQNVKKSYEKWLSFQVLVKEGIEVRTKNIIEYIEKKYGKKPIFDNYNDFDFYFKEKEDNNIRLLDKKTKINEEKDKLIKEYNYLKNDFVINNKNDNINFQEKEKILSLLKIRNRKFNNLKNNLLNKKRITISKSLQNFNTYNQENQENYIDKDKEKDIDIEKDLKMNPLGVYCFNLDKVKNITKIINCIYISILKNKIKGLNISDDTIYRINNTLLKDQKTLLQIQVIECSLNYLKSSIEDKKKDINNQQIIKGTKEIIDLYHKTIKAKLYEEERKKKLSLFMHKMEEKSKKVYFIPNKKFNKYPAGLYLKPKTFSVNKNKKNNFELFDFLYD